MDKPITIEICVADVESAIAAEAGGADRIELCDNLLVGGTTPSVGTIAEVCRWLSLPVHVLIRPRGGGFVYSDRELAVMRRDIEAAKTLGAAGVVFGVLDVDARVDRERAAALLEAARPLSVTFHKAIDQAREPLEAIEALAGIGVDRVLTSGGRPTALEGCAELRNMMTRSAGRLAVMAGGRLAIDHLENVVRASGVAEVHLGSAACRVVSEGGSETTGSPGETSWSRTDARLVAAIVDRVRGFSPSP